MVEEEVSALSSFLSDLTTRINEVQERTRILTERISILNTTMLKQQEKQDKEKSAVKQDIEGLKHEIERLKIVAEHVIDESSEFARKQELEILEKQVKIFEPLKYTTKQDVLRLIREELEKRKRK